MFVICIESVVYGRFSPAQENKHQIWPNRSKIEPAWLSVPIFLFQFEPVIHNLDDKKLKYSQLFWSGGAQYTNMEKSPDRSDPMLIFMSGNRGGIQ